MAEEGRPLTATYGIPVPEAPEEDTSVPLWAYELGAMVAFRSYLALTKPGQPWDACPYRVLARSRTEHCHYPTLQRYVLEPWDAQGTPDWWRLKHGVWPEQMRPWSEEAPA